MGFYRIRPIRGTIHGRVEGAARGSLGEGVCGTFWGGHCFIARRGLRVIGAQNFHVATNRATRRVGHGDFVKRQKEK